MSEDENDIEGVSSKEFSIDYKEMQNKYYKSIAMVIIAPIIVAFIFYYMGFILGLLSISILILIEFYGIFGIVTYKFRLKQKISEGTKIPDEDLKINYYKSILLVIFTPILFIYAFIFYFTGFGLGVLSMFPIGFVICFYGLYGIYLYKFKPEKFREILEKMRGRGRMENTRKLQSLYIIEFVIGFSLAGIGFFVVLTVIFCTSFMHQYCIILFPGLSLNVLSGWVLSIIALSIGLTLVIDGYLRFKRMRIIQIKVRNHLNQELVPNKVSGKESLLYCCLIFIVVVIWSYVFLFFSLKL